MNLGNINTVLQVIDRELLDLDDINDEIPSYQVIEVLGRVRNVSIRYLPNDKDLRSDIATIIGEYLWKGIKTESKLVEALKEIRDEVTVSVGLERL